MAVILWKNKSLLVYSQFKIWLPFDKLKQFARVCRSLAEKRQNISMVAFISDWPHAVWILGDLRRRLEPLGPLAQLALLLD